MVSVGNTFGTGDTIYMFQILGNSPSLTKLYITSVRGAASSHSNSFMIFAGISYLVVEVFVLIRFKYSYTWCSAKIGVDLRLVACSRLTSAVLIIKF